MYEVKRIEQDGDPDDYFNFGESKLKEKPRVILLQLSFRVIFCPLFAENIIAMG